jgi:hypothetical protein
MMRRRDPLVPLSLFRSRSFATINLATLLIYGALYSTFTFQSLFLQGVLGYSPPASAVVGLPISLMLTFFSAKVGSLAGRYGARPFLVTGPLLMAAGLAWFARIPASSVGWNAQLNDPASFVPPTSVFVDVLPAILLFGVGISLIVAPLTSTLMSSVPVGRAGVASAINNALSRVGQPLLSAVIFIVISGSFYTTLVARVPGVDPSSSELRAQVQPVNRPLQGTSPELQAAARVASTDAFHLASLVGVGLLVAGAAVNWFGLAGSRAARTAGPQPQEPEEPVGAPG